MSDQTENTFKSKTTWTRFLFILLYALCFNVAEIVLAAIAIIQFASSLITGAPLKQLQIFGTSLSSYLKQVADFLTYASDNKPFPISPWPEERDIVAEAEEDVIVMPAAPPETKPSPAAKTIEEKGDDPVT